MKLRLVAATAALIGALGTAHAENVVRANVVSGLPPIFLWVKHMEETFMPAVDKALEGTGYSMEWTKSFGGTLAKQGGELEALEAQLAEIGVVPTVFESSNLPLHSVTYVSPFGATDPEQVLQAFNDLHDTIEAMRTSWHTFDVEYLGGGFALDNYLMMTKFPLRQVADLEGRKIGAPGPAVNWLKGTGAVGVAGSLPTYYNDLQTGVIDGIVVFATAAAPAKLFEVAPYVTQVNFGAQYAGSLAANKTWFDAQPQAVKDAMHQAAAEYTVAYTSELLDRVASSLETMVEGGATIEELAPEERAAWASVLPNVPAEWVQQTEADGLPAGEILSSYMEALRQLGVELPRDWDKEM